MDWINKLMNFKAGCQAGQIMTESQARILRATLYRYEAIRRNCENPGSYNDPEAYGATDRMIEKEIFKPAESDEIKIKQKTLKDVIDVLTSLLPK